MSTRPKVVGNVEARPGQKATGALAVPGTEIGIPVTIVNGVADGPTLLITAGIHGGEYPSIEAAIRLAKDLKPSEVSGTVILIPIVSPDAFHARQQYLHPADGKNVNRQFPGRALGTVSERIAHTVMTSVIGHQRADEQGHDEQARPLVDAWIDMHGGDIHEALVPVAGYLEEGKADVQRRAKAMSEIFGIKHIIHPKDLPGTTFKMAASLDIPCIVAEAGQCGQMDEESVRILVRGCRYVAQMFRILSGNPPPVGDRVDFRDYPWIRSEHRGCWYPSVKIGDTVKKGQVVGEVKDYFGELIGRYEAPANGVIILLSTSLATNVTDPLYGMGVP